MTGLPHIAVRHYALTLVGCVLLAFLPGAVGSAFGPDAWYAAIDKSSLTPPGFVFPIVWSLLYLMIGVSLFAFLNTGERDRFALLAFGAQLVLNGLWSYLFFGLHAPGAALVDIALLWIAIVATIIAFARHSRLAAWLLAPYLVWVSFATYLNFAIWIAN